MLLDSSVRDQMYIEDCEVCCRPIEVTVNFDKNELVSFSGTSVEE
jgi:hypothetical protein